MNNLKNKLSQMLELFDKEQMSSAQSKIEYEAVEEKLEQIFECKASKIIYAAKNEIINGKLENLTGLFLFSDSELIKYYPFITKEHKGSKATKFNILVMYKDVNDFFTIDKGLVEEYLNA